METRGHRDNYRIKDVDDSDGLMWGEQRWKREEVPEVLYVGWDEADVLGRWEDGVKTALAERGFLGQAEMERAVEMQRQQQLLAKQTGVAAVRGYAPTNLMWGMPASSTKAEEHKKKATVKLSADAGRFLCEYALFESLSRRWVDARDAAGQKSQHASRSTSSPSSIEDVTNDRLGKVAFLHVPGWTGVEDINRGVMVAEEAIRALVGSWEDGYRRNRRLEAKAYTQQHSEEKGKVAGNWKA